MKKLSTHSVQLLLLSIFLLQTGCQKESVQQDNPSRTEVTNKVISWLEKQKGTATVNGVLKIQSLKESLDFSLLTTEFLSPDESLIIVPISNSFLTNSNLDKHPTNSLVLFVNKNKEIRKGNIIQYISSREISGNKELSKFFSNYYNLGSTDFKGSLASLTVSDEFSYEVNYIDGKLNYYKSVGKKQTGGRSETCYEIGFYYYWSDGSVTWEPIGGYCDGCEPVRTINGKTYKVNCSGGGGGGPEEGVILNRELSWDVYSEHMTGPDATVIGKIFLLGKRVSGEPQGGHFTSTREAENYTQNFFQYGMTWSSYNQSWVGTQHAYHMVQGNVFYSDPGVPARYVSKTKTWEFIEVFP